LHQLKEILTKKSFGGLNVNYICWESNLTKWLHASCVHLALAILLCLWPSLWWSLTSGGKMISYLHIRREVRHLLSCLSSEVITSTLSSNYPCRKASRSFCESSFYSKTMRLSVLETNLNQFVKEVNSVLVSAVWDGETNLLAWTVPCAHLKVLEWSDFSGFLKLDFEMCLSGKSPTT